MNENTGYVSTLLKPIAGKASDRRVWSIPLGGVWLPFFTATNAVGETAIAHEVLGAPVRLQKEKDGTPRFSKSGRPIMRLVKELSDQIRIIRENFAFSLVAYADGVRKAHPDEYKAQVEVAQKAGTRLVQADADTLANYLEAQAEKAQERELVPA